MRLQQVPWQLVWQSSPWPGRRTDNRMEARQTSAALEGTTPIRPNSTRGQGSATAAVKMTAEP